MKKKIKDLAVFGGTPLFDKTLHVGTPNTGSREKLFARIEDLLERNWLTNRGPYVKEFEEKVAQMVGIKHCIAMANGTIALEIAIRALGMTGEVIVPSFTFIATAHALQWQGIKPVFCDIDAAAHNIDPAAVEALITPRTTGNIGTHVWGRPCHIENLTRIAGKHNLKLLFDAAHAFACSYKGRMIGRFGDAEVFSFHATKFFNTFEGGAVVTDNDELAEKIRLMKNFGFAGVDKVIYIGTNGKMNEVSAAMGLTSFESMAEFIEANRNNYLYYKEKLMPIPGIEIAPYNEKEKCNYQYVVLEIDASTFGVSRDELVKIFSAENIRARRYFYPGCHLMEPYATLDRGSMPKLPRTDVLCERVLTLPTGRTIDKTDIDKIAALFMFVHNKSNEIKEKT